MKYIKMFEQFINEDAVRAGEDSKIYIDDMKLDTGKTIKGAEILGVVIDAETEKELKSYFYKNYGQSDFTEEEMSTLVKYWNDYRAEIASDEKEDEEDEEGGDDAGGDLDLDI